MPYHRVESVVDQHLTQDMANYQLSRSLVSVGYYVNVETRSSIAHSHPYYELILVRRGVLWYTAFDILFFADKINNLPRKILGYHTPEELFEQELDRIYRAA